MGFKEFPRPLTKRNGGYLCPVRNWKIENDLWHHPRKYIVPLIMFLVAGLIGMWSINIWVLLCIVIAEVLSLSLVVRRI